MCAWLHSGTYIPYLLYVPVEERRQGANDERRGPTYPYQVRYYFSTPTSSQNSRIRSHTRTVSVFKMTTGGLVYVIKITGLYHPYPCDILCKIPPMPVRAAHMSSAIVRLPPSLDMLGRLHRRSPTTTSSRPSLARTLVFVLRSSTRGVLIFRDVVERTDFLGCLFCRDRDSSLFSFIPFSFENAT